MKKKIMFFIVGVVVLLVASGVSAFAQTKRIDVNFRPGNSGGTYKDSVTGYGTADFYVKASGGQTMTVRLTSPSRFLYFTVLRGSTDGGPVADDAREVTEWSGVLPADGTYIVRIYLVRAEARRNKRPVKFDVRFDIK